MSIEAAVFNTEAKKIRMGHYDFTHQLGREDFIETRDRFNYTKKIRKVWKEAFIGTCAPLMPAPGGSKRVEVVT